MPAVKMEIQLHNRMEDLDRLTRQLDRFCHRAGLGNRCYGQVCLALEELFANIVQHGNVDGQTLRIAVFLALVDDILTVRIEDDGIPFDPNAAAQPDLNCSLEQRKIGGLGIHLIKKSMDEVRYLRCENKNVTILKKTVKGPRCRSNHPEDEK